MAAWSSVRKLLTGSIVTNNIKQTAFNQNVKFSVNTVMRSGHGGPRIMGIQSSRWQWNKFKDMLHYYIMVGAIPCGLVIFLSNVLVGPAQLEPIPEGYVPKHWEYYSHPITRFIARYIHQSPQEDYEKFMHWAYEEKEQMQIRELEKDILAKMQERQDYQAFYYKPFAAKYIRRYQAYEKEVDERLGDRRG